MAVAARGVHHNAVLGTLASWTHKYCPFVFCGSERLASEFSFRFLASQLGGLWKAQHEHPVPTRKPITPAVDKTMRTTDSFLSYDHRRQITADNGTKKGPLREAALPGLRHRPLQSRRAFRRPFVLRERRNNAICHGQKSPPRDMGGQKSPPREWPKITYKGHGQKSPTYYIYQWAWRWWCIRVVRASFGGVVVQSSSAGRRRCRRSYGDKE